VNVSGQSGPWEWVNGGLNTNYQYNAASLDNQPPTVVGASGPAGISITPGDALTLTYLSGTWTGGTGYGTFDANGDPSVVISSASSAGGNTGDGFEWEPGHWCPPSEFPHNWSELMGVFTDSSGSIVGLPYAIGDSRSLIIPSGATQLELGIEDAYLRDNVGSITMTVSETPEPSTIALLGSALLGLGVVYLRRRSAKS